MQVFSVQDPQAADAAIAALRQNQVIAAPTETVYGLMARWNSPTARNLIFTLKHRPADKKLQMLILDLASLAAFNLRNQDWIQAIGSRFWPGPLTLIVETQEGETIGARIPNHPFILSVLRKLGEPIAATSANLSGRPPAANAQDAVRDLQGQPGVLIDAGKVTVTGGTASTVASIVGRKLTILRPGIITEQQLADALKALP